MEDARANAARCHASCLRTSRATERRGSSLTLARSHETLIDYRSDYRFVWVPEHTDTRPIRAKDLHPDAIALTS